MSALAERLSRLKAQAGIPANSPVGAAEAAKLLPSVGASNSPVEAKASRLPPLPRGSTANARGADIPVPRRDHFDRYCAVTTARDTTLSSV